MEETNISLPSVFTNKSTKAPPSASAHNHIKAKRTIGIVQLTFIGITSIIGSGCLFGAYQSAKIAGPAAIFAWLIGAFALLLIALTLAELGPLFPQSGGAARYLEYTHGSLAGFLGGWVSWLGIAASIPTEAAASIQYLSSIKNFQGLFDAATGGMSASGLAVASLLMLFYFFINYWTLALFLRSMTYITVFKLVVPVLSVAAIMWAGFQPGNFGHDYQTFAPYGISGIFMAVASGGVIFAFNGFQSIVNFAGEAKNPNRMIPIALISSIVICLIVYLLLQVGFIGALSPQDLMHGWHGLNFSSPFVQLAIAFNLNLVTLLMYINAVVSPSGTGIAYTGASARMLFGMQRNGYMPKAFGKLHHRRAIPRNGVWFTLIFGFILLWIFRGWGNLANVISITNTLSYIPGPIALMGLRHIAPEWRSPCHIRGMQIIAPLSFVIVSLILYWSRWPLTGEVLFVIFGGLGIYLYYQQKNSWVDIRQHLKNGLWFVIYLFTMAILSLLGSKTFGGINTIPTPYDQIAVAIVALLFYYWGVKSAWSTPKLQEFRKNQDML